jgi:hypothetical protein
VPFGVGAIDGKAARPLKVLDDGARSATDTNAGIVGIADLLPEQARPARSTKPKPRPKPEYAPGEEPRPRDGEPTASAHGELL